MADGYVVSPFALNAAAGTWHAQSETLRGGRKRLLDAEEAVPALGPVGGPAAAAWLDTWIERVKSFADTAEAHGDALEAAAGAYLAQERYVEEDLAQLLPWSQREGTPPGSGSYP